MILSVEECWDAFFFFFSCLFVFSEHSNSRRRHALKKEDKTFLYKKRFPCASIRIHKSQRLRRSSWRLRFEPLLRRTGPVEIPPIWNLGWSLSRSIWAKGMWGLANSSTFLFFSLKGFLAALLWHTVLCRIQSKCSCLKPNICNILYIRSMCMWTFWLLSPNNTSLVIAVHTKSTLT